MTEYFDILDQNGKLTGNIKSREETHRDGDWHRTVHVWIINSSQELLIQKRAATIKAHPNLWHVSVAGHIAAGEDATTTVLKETEEELGIKLNPKNIEYLFAIKHQCILNNGTYIGNHFNDVYIVHLDLDIKQLCLQKEEVAEVQFVHFKKLQKIMKNRKADFVPHDDEYAKLFKILDGRYRQKSTNKKSHIFF